MLLLLLLLRPLSATANAITTDDAAGIVQPSKYVEAGCNMPMISQLAYLLLLTDSTTDNAAAATATPFRCATAATVAAMPLWLEYDHCLFTLQLKLSLILMLLLNSFSQVLGSGAHAPTISELAATVTDKYRWH